MKAARSGSYLFFIVCGLLAGALAQIPAPDVQDYSGMYSFLKDGEFIQVTLEEKSVVSGFISRYGDSASDKGTFLDQFLKSGNWNGKHLTFTTEAVHGVSYAFEGDFDRGSGKKPADEGYYILRGALTRTVNAADGKNATTQIQQVEFRSFPRDADAAQ